MTTLVALLLIAWEPLNFATELLRVLPSLTYRGTLAVVELLAHGGSAALSVTAGMALLNGLPDARRLATLALLVSFTRIVQSHVWSVLPNNTPPGAAPFQILIAACVTAGALAVVWRGRG